MSSFKDKVETLTNIKASLKWFNSPKGFGFLVPEGKDIDAFLHITTLQEAGYHALGEGAEVICNIAFGDKGAIITKIEKVISSGNVPIDMCPNDISMNDSENVKSGEMNGIVKWYKPEEGFGFIIPEDGMKDVFVHKSCLDKYGIEKLEAGQKLKMQVRAVAKGREATLVEINENKKSA